eukprot:3134589-Pleurochrysis_carterae.AAC.1
MSRPFAARAEWRRACGTSGTPFCRGATRSRCTQSRNGEDIRSPWAHGVCPGRWRTISSVQAFQHRRAARWSRAARQ